MAKKKSVPPPSKGGISRQFLTDNYGVLPSNPVELCNGHILFLFTDNARQLTKTCKALENQFSKEFPLHVVKKICIMLNKLRCLSDECQMNRFKTFCLAAFKVITNPCLTAFKVIHNPDNEQGSASAAVTVTSTDPSTSHDTTSVVTPSHRRGTRCLQSQCTSTRKRLAFVVKDRAEMRRKHLLNIKLLRRKLQSNSTAKRVNQKFKRMESQIQKLKAEQDGDKELELRRTKLALQKSRKNLRNLKMYLARKDSNQLAHE